MASSFSSPLLLYHKQVSDPVQDENGELPATTTKEGEDSNDKDVGSNSDEGSEEEDPNWDEMAQFHPPMEASIRSFLETRERLQAADQAFKNALDEIHAGLKNDVEKYLSMSESFIKEREQSLSNLEEEIQFNIISNHKRGCEYEDRVQATQNEMHSFLSNLMAKIGRGRRS